MQLYRPILILARAIDHRVGENLFWPIDIVTKGGMIHSMSGKLKRESIR